MNIKSGLLALGLLGGAGGCGGQTSYFEVSVKVGGGVSTPCLSTINSCDVIVNGGGNETFTLLPGACRMPTSSDLGTFQYSTDQESGNVSFHVAIVNGNVEVLGEGDSAAVPIKAGQRQGNILVTVNPNDKCPR